MDEQVACREFAHILEDGHRRRDRVERQKALDGIEVDSPLEARLPEERLQLRPERELVVGQAVVQRLDPEAVASENQAVTARVPDRDREHAAQRMHKIEAPLLVQVYENFGVAVGREPVPCLLEFPTESPVVVDLPVLHHAVPPIFVRDRLVAVFEVDDREPPHGKADGPVDRDAFAVRPSIRQRPAHLAKHRRFRT